jgi:hypothetical protein
VRFEAFEAVSSILRSSRLRRRVVLKMDTKVSEELVATISNAEYGGGKFLRRVGFSTKFHGVPAQKTAILRLLLLLLLLLRTGQSLRVTGAGPLPNFNASVYKKYFDEVLICLRNKSTLTDLYFV